MMAQARRRQPKVSTASSKTETSAQASPAEEKESPVVPTIDDVVNRAGKLDAKPAGHDGEAASGEAENQCNKQRPDPIGLPPLMLPDPIRLAAFCSVPFYSSRNFSLAELLD